MSNLKEEIGRLFVVGFYGVTISEEIKKMIHDYRVGNIILFSRNIGTIEEIKQLTADLQNEAKLAGYTTPLLITLDQENGVVKRIEEGVSHLPGAMTIGSTEDINNAFDVYRASAKELKALGINWNLAPVADVNNNPMNPVIGVRSFGENPRRVAEFVSEAVRGMQEENVMATLKHFPGHGDTHVDSHKDLPVIHKTLEELSQMELIPFEEGIKAGADCVMLAHIDLPEITEDHLPASLSKNVMDILRKKLNFSGVITTDDLGMKAISERIGEVEATVIAVKNGCDLIMLSHSHEMQRKALETLYKRAMEDKELEKMIHASYKRVIEMGIRYNQQYQEIDFSALTKANQKMGNEIYRKSLVEIPYGSIKKLSSEDHISIVDFSLDAATGVEDRSHDYNHLADKLAKENISVNNLSFSTEEKLDTVMTKISTLDQKYPIIVMTKSLRSGKDLPAKIVQRLTSENYTVIVLALRNPYDYDFVPEKTSFLATFEPTPEALDVVVDFLLGKEQVLGKCPVTLEKKKNIC